MSKSSSRTVDLLYISLDSPTFLCITKCIDQFISEVSKQTPGMNFEDGSGKTQPLHKGMKVDSMDYFTAGKPEDEEQLKGSPKERRSRKSKELATADILVKAKLWQIDAAIDQPLLDTYLGKMVFDRVVICAPQPGKNKESICF
jgi:hypothetical protein